MMQHTPQELALLKAAIQADPVAEAARVAGNVEAVLGWLNAPTTTLAWKPLVLYKSMVESLKYNTFDSISAGKQKAFEIMLDAAKSGVLDGATTNKARNGIADIFAVTGGYTDAVQALQMLNGAFVEFASNAQVALGYTTPPAVATLTAVKRNFTGTCDESTANWLINN